MKLTPLLQKVQNVRNWLTNQRLWTTVGYCAFKITVSLENRKHISVSNLHKVLEVLYDSRIGRHSSYRTLATIANLSMTIYIKEGTKTEYSRKIGPVLFFGDIPLTHSGKNIWELDMTIFSNMQEVRGVNLFEKLIP